MSLGIRSRTTRPAYEETSEHFQVWGALPWSAEKPNVPLSSPALPGRIRAHTLTLNTGTSEASVMREDRDRVDVFHGTLSMITGTSLRGFSHLDAAELQASYDGPALFLHAHRNQRHPRDGNAAARPGAHLKGSPLTWVFWGCCSSLTHNASVVLTGSNSDVAVQKKQNQIKTWSSCWRRSLWCVNALFRFSRLHLQLFFCL